MIEKDHNVVLKKKKKVIRKKRKHSRNLEDPKLNGKRPGRKKLHKKKYNKKKSVVKVLLILLLAVLVGAMAFAGFTYLKKQNSKKNAMAIMQEVKQLRREKEKNAELRFLKNLQERQQSSKLIQGEWEKLWLEKIELTTENINNFATVESCLLSENNSSIIEVRGTIPGLPVCDSDELYLFSMFANETELKPDAKPIASYRINKSRNDFLLEANLNYKKANSNLFKKFVVAVQKDGEYRIISRSRFITNPEQMAKYNVYKDVDSKKGLLVSPHRLNTGELEDLGIRQAIYNIPFSKICGHTTSGNYPTIHYNYNGKTYNIDGQSVAEYDIIFGTLSKKGIRVTAVLLNDVNVDYRELIHPNARSGSSAPYVMFNGEEEDGINCMAAMATFLAERYSGNGHGLVSNWVVANEINARKEWNYMEYTDVHSYSQAYANAFRVMYNAIKSVNGGAKIYMPLDQTWNRNVKNSKNYDARDVINEFNTIIKDRGNIDWQLAYHPYPVPLTKANFWNTGNYFRKLTTDSPDTAMVSMKNIHVVTDYLRNEDFLTETGEFREVLLSEQGFTSASGEAVQAAAVAYAYLVCEHNSQISGFLLNRQIDAAEEVSQGLSFGLLNTGGGRKQAYNVYKKMGTSEQDEAAEFAKGIIGISKWSEVIKDR